MLGLDININKVGFWPYWCLDCGGGVKGTYSGRGGQRYMNENVERDAPTPTQHAVMHDIQVCAMVWLGSL